MPLRIAIDASRTTVARLTGTEHYALQLIRHLIQLNDTVAAPHRLHLYFRDAPPADLLPASPHVVQHVIPWRRAWTHLRFAAAIYQHRPDVTFVPAHTLPFVFPGRSLVTVHDLGYKYFPASHTRAGRWYLDLTTRYSAQRATRVLADSQATAHDLGRCYGVSQAKITVAYPGVAAPYIGDVAQVRQKYGLPERYFLFIGTLQPRKNIQRIVQAFARWQASHGDDTATALVLAGGQGWLYDPAWVQGVPNVLLPGYIDEADKGALMAGALALVFPTLYEGFGFPVIEAMHCGTPVIVSNTSSLPELVGDAGLLVDPLDVAAIAQALQAVQEQPDSHKKGYQQAARFTWANCARVAWDTLCLSRPYAK